MEKTHTDSQFVIQQHYLPDGNHWDLMLEKGEKLWTWRVDIHPAMFDNPIIAERIFDHPLKFLTYEGSVQNGAGSVQIVDKGILSFHDIKADRISFTLNGNVLNGIFTLQLDDPPLWTLTRVEN